MDARLTYRLIADLFDELERAGHKPSPGKYLQVQELLRRLPPDTPPERLRTLLTPLLAADPAQQRLLYELFDKSLAQARAVVRDDDDDAEHDAPAADAPRRGERRWRRAALACLLALAATSGFLFDAALSRPWANPTLWAAAAVAAALLWAAWRLLDRPGPRAAFLAAAALLAALGATLKTGLEPAPPPAAPPRTLYVNASPGDTLRRALHDPRDTARLLDATPRDPVESPAAGRYAADTAGLLTYVAPPDAPAGAADSLRVLLHYAARTDTVYIGVAFVAPTAPPPPPDTNLLESIPLPYPTDLGPLRVDAAEAARFDWYRRYEWPLKALLALLLGALAWALARWDQYRRARAVAELRRADRAPYVWSPDTGADLASAWADEAAQPLLTRLRGRAPDDRLRLDLRATVRATSRRAGRISLVYRRQTLPPDYLLLIDRLAPNDHRALLFDALYQAFLRAEAPVTRYFYNGDPRRCYNEHHPDGVALAELAHRHAGAQLLLVGDGRGLLAHHTGRPAPWTTLLDAWPRRALLSPRPGGDWDARERQLADLLPVLPASPGGMSAALDLFVADDPTDPRDLLRRVHDAARQPLEFRHELIDDLQRRFDPATVDWIAACALWPTLHWNLTLFLGQTLRQHAAPAHAPNPEPAAAGHTSTTLVALFSALPWFAQGRIPEGARIQLLDYLAARGLEAPLRAALRDLLRRAPAPPPDSAAYDDYRMNVALNELLLKPDPATRRRLERVFEAYLAAGKKPDFVTLRLLDRPAGRLDVLVGDRLKKYAFRQGLPRLGWRLAPRLLAAWAVLAGALALFQPNLNPCPGETVRYQNETLCLNTGRDRLTYLEYLAADAAEAGNHARVDSLRAAADQIAPLDSAFYLNTAARYYNLGARYSNCAEQTGCTANPDSLRARACDYFRRGGALYSARMGSPGYQYFRAAERACAAAPDTSGAAKPPVEFTFSGTVVDAETGKPVPGAVVAGGTPNIRATEGVLAAMKPFEWELTGLTLDTAGPDGRYALRFGFQRLGTRFCLAAAAPGYRTTALLTAPRDPLPTLRLTPSDAAREAAATLIDTAPSQAAPPAESDTFAPVKFEKVNNVVFLLDISDSMDTPDKLPLMLGSIQRMVPFLREADQVSLITFADEPLLVLSGVSGDQHRFILGALEGHKARGKTNGKEALQVAFRYADTYFVENGNNIVIMATDGRMETGKLKSLAATFAKRGIRLVVFLYGTPPPHIAKAFDEITRTTNGWQRGITAANIDTSLQDALLATLRRQ